MHGMREGPEARTSPVRPFRQTIWIIQQIGSPSGKPTGGMHMSTLLTINVVNLESATQGFYFFQQPAIYTGGATVYSNSLYSQSLGNYSATGSTLTFQVNLQYYAGKIGREPWRERGCQNV